MVKPVDHTGRRIGMLTVVRKIGRKAGRPLWRCMCDCGTPKNIVSIYLDGRFTSCGNHMKELLSAQNKTHGMSKTAIYAVWRGMVQRCEPGGDPNYGGRGISICARWKYSFPHFLADMGLPPEAMSIDRIDTNGNYEPGNCRWATQAQQMRNTRRTIKVEYRGRLLSMKDIYEMEPRKVPFELFRSRIRTGWGVDTALNVLETGRWKATRQDKIREARS